MRNTLVELNGDVVGQLVPRLVELLEAADDVGQRGRAPEVLLLQPELLAGVVRVVRIEDAGNGLGRLGGLDRGGVRASVEGGEIEAGDRLGCPKTDVGGRLGAVACRSEKPPRQPVASQSKSK
jgi:hypothetical protein